MLGYFYLDIILKAYSFPQATLSENFSILGITTLQRQISQHIFTPNGGCFFIYSGTVESIFLINMTTFRDPSAMTETKYTVKGLPPAIYRWLGRVRVGHVVRRSNSFSMDVIYWRIIFLIVSLSFSVMFSLFCSCTYTVELFHLWS